MNNEFCSAVVRRNCVVAHLNTESVLAYNISPPKPLLLNHHHHHQILADCDPARLAALSYPRLGAAAGGLGSMYSTQYPSTDQNPYPSIAMENSFYGPLVSHGLLARYQLFFIIRCFTCARASDMRD